MWRFTLLSVLELVITLPDHTAVFGSRMPHFRAEETATAGADEFCRENGTAAILDTLRHQNISRCAQAQIMTNPY